MRSHVPREYPPQINSPLHLLFVGVDRCERELWCPAVAGQVPEVEVGFGDPCGFEVHDQGESKRRLVPELVVAMEVAVDQNVGGRAAGRERIVDPVALPVDQFGALVVDECGIVGTQSAGFGLGRWHVRREIGEDECRWHGVESGDEGADR